MDRVQVGIGDQVSKRWPKLCKRLRTTIETQVGRRHFPGCRHRPQNHDVATSRSLGDSEVARSDSLLFYLLERSGGRLARVASAQPQKVTEVISVVRGKTGGDSKSGDLWSSEEHVYSIGERRIIRLIKLTTFRVGDRVP